MKEKQNWLAQRTFNSYNLGISLMKANEWIDKQEDFFHKRIITVFVHTRPKKRGETSYTEYRYTILYKGGKFI
jgi:hypothetical protein